MKIATARALALEKERGGGILAMAAGRGLPVLELDRQMRIDADHELRGITLDTFSQNRLPDSVR